MHGSPREIEIIVESEVKLVCSSRIIKFTSSELLEEGNFVINSKSCQKRDNYARNEELLMKKLILRIRKRARKEHQRSYLIKPSVTRLVPGLEAAFIVVKLDTVREIECV